VVKSLLERGLLKIDGHKEVPGRPMLYSTTRRFLEVFGLQSIKNLPALRELEDLAREHGLKNPDATDAAKLTDAEDSAEEGGEVVVDGEDEQLDLGAESLESPDIDADAPEIVAAAAADSDEGLNTEDLGEDEEASPAFDDEVSAEFDDESSSELDGEASPEHDEEASPDLDEEASFQDDAQDAQADDDDDGGAQTRTIEIASERDVLEGELDPDGEEPEIVLPSSE
jgi:segregation and condensation protein B